MSQNTFSPLPSMGAWQLIGAYTGFEVTRFSTTGDQITLHGTSLGVEAGTIWNLDYAIDLDSNWHVQRAVVNDRAGLRLVVETDGAGRNWRVNGEPRPDLDGYLDFDLEASAVTNTIPVHRLALAVGDKGQSAAAYVRTNGLKVERLAQTYRRIQGKDGFIAFDYESPRFGYHDVLHFARDGLVVEYPEIGKRILV